MFRFVISGGIEPSLILLLTPKIHGWKVKIDVFPIVSQVFFLANP